MSSSVPEKAATSEQPPPYAGIQQPPPPQVMYPPQQPGMTTTIVTTQPVGALVRMVYGPQPVSMTCPHCQSAIVTSTTFEPGMLTWLVCGGVALMGCWCGCCFIPFCLDEVKDCRHTCPNCKNFLGVYRQI